MEEKSFRFKMNHIGDIIVDNVVKGLKVIKDSTKGIVITYDMYDLRRKRKKTLMNIGLRVYEIRNATPEHDLFNDHEILGHFRRLNDIEGEIEERTREREERLYPGTYSAIYST